LQIASNGRSISHACFFLFSCFAGSISELGTIDPVAAKRRSRRKRVRFVSEDPVVFSVPNRLDYTVEELHAAFFQKADYDQITKACCKQILKLSKGFQLRDKKYCARGLEAHAPKASLTKALTKQAATAAVMNEQSYQRSEGMRNEEWIAEVYRNATSSSRLWAHRIGMMDRKAVEDMMDK